MARKYEPVADLPEPCRFKMHWSLGAGLTVHLIINDADQATMHALNEAAHNLVSVLQSLGKPVKTTIEVG